MAALNVMGLGRGRSSHRGRGHVSRLALFDGSSKNLWLAFRRNHQRNRIAIGARQLGNNQKCRRPKRKANTAGKQMTV